MTEAIVSNPFSPAMLKAFRAQAGAFSPVTANEFKKSQITLVREEQQLAENFLGDRLVYHHGSVEAIVEAGYNPEVIFRLHPTGEPIGLNLTYKTGKPNELRLYLRAQFRPRPDENWCIFVRSDELWIGHFSPWMLNEIEAGRLAAPGSRVLPEPEIDDFQQALNAGPPAQIASKALKWQRNPKIAAEALEFGHYTCELYPMFPVFESRRSGNPFLEAHHLVPMAVQGDFKTVSLDVAENICVLNPLAHRKLHYAPYEAIVGDLRRLIARRRKFLDAIGIVPDDVLRLYE